MSCSSRNLNNLDTTVYSTTSCPSSNNNPTVTIQFIDGATPFSQGGNSQSGNCSHGECNHQRPEEDQETHPTNTFALFYNAATTGAEFEAGDNIPFPSTLYNTSDACKDNGITNNNGIITLSTCNKENRSYLINYQVTGSFEDAELGIAVNGIVDTNSIIAADSNDDTTISGSYIVTVPRKTATTVALTVVSGEVETGTPTVGTNISVVRID